MSLKSRVDDLASVHEDEETRRSYADLREETHIKMHSIDLRHGLHSFKSSEQF